MCTFNYSLHYNYLPLFILSYTLCTYIKFAEGPFLISCGNDKMCLYWKIDDCKNIVATSDVTTASIFYVTSTDDDSHPYEFMILYYGEDENATMRPKGALDPTSKEETLSPLPLYVNGSVSLFGYNDGPLEVKTNVKEENVRFVLHSRIFLSLIHI